MSMQEDKDFLEQGHIQNSEDEPLEQSDSGFFQSWFGLPTALQRAVMKRFLLAIGCVFLGILSCAAAGGLGGLFMVVIAIGSVFMGLSIIWDWYRGRIIETMAICITVDSSALKKRTRVTFVAQDDPTEYYVYNVPGVKVHFTPSVTYLTYVKEETPDLLLAWMAL